MLGHVNHWITAFPAWGYCVSAGQTHLLQLRLQGYRAWHAALQHCLQWVSPASACCRQVSQLWQLADGELCKDQQYWLPLKKNPFAPPEAYAIEHFVCQHRSGAGFIVTTRSTTPNVSAA